MTRAFRPKTLILFVGDIWFLIFALWLALFLRAFEIPTRELFVAHLIPFTFLFVGWILVFFVAGLYERRSLLLARRALSNTLLTAQTINIVLAALFFFFIPLFGIAPKTILFIYLFTSLVLMLVWRAFIFPWLGFQKPENTLVIGASKEVKDLASALSHARYTPTKIVAIVDPGVPNLSQTIEQKLLEHEVRILIADFKDPRVSNILTSLYNFLARGLRYFDALDLYEEMFGRVPLLQINDDWVSKYVSSYVSSLYDAIKRITDIVIAFPALIISLALYPFVALAIKIEDRGPVLISMPRVGEGGKVFNFYKFRSMSGNDKAEYGPGGATKLHVTHVGKFIRKTRIDELPQLWNVLRGDLSLIGPRPESPSLVAMYAKEIPHYPVRHLIKPGLSGWAQLYYHGDPHHATDVEATRMKLSYDLYYVKHRSVALDLIIVLKTIRRLLTKSNA